MRPDIMENFKVKLNIVVVELIQELENNIIVMARQHSAKGLIRSGNTIKCTMDFIAKGNANLFQIAISHIESLDCSYSIKLEGDVQAIMSFAHDSFKKESLIWLRKSTELAGNPKLYERMLPEVELSMSSDWDKFLNLLDALVIKLKHSQKMSLFTKICWFAEAIILLVSVFIAGIWYEDPDGNYEPIIVGLLIVISIIALIMKLSRKLN